MAFFIACYSEIHVHSGPNKSAKIGIEMMCSDPNDLAGIKGGHLYCVAILWGREWQLYFHFIYARHFLLFGSGLSNPQAGSYPLNLLLLAENGRSAAFMGLI
mmetsp:Transcript_141869/g.344573  ORF Transcript_141869/g.344573 Transcript_141869/m.344573 type:complete len:102 (-) Transcript_141869:69-374(-)